ncbi:MAG: SH3 domain-containing protein [Weeksellaceae bacterium]
MVTASDSDGVYIRSEAGATAEQTVVGGLVPPERFGVAGCKVLNGVNWYYGTKELDGVTGWVHGSFVVPAP